MALQEAKAMGLDLMPDPETFANPPRDLQNQNQRAKYLYDSNLPEDWGSTASESGDDDADNLNDDEELAQYMLETGGLTDREVDRLDGKTSNRLGVRDSTAAGGMGASGPNGTKNYPERETGANTGPKGVLADQKYHQQQQLQERLSNQQAYNARMLAKAPTTTTFREDQARERREKKAQGLLDKDDEADAEKEDAEDAEEKAILDRIRINRLKDMSWAAQKNAAGGPGGAGGKKVFGSLMEMNAAQYVSAIDSEKKDVTVVIHIYSEFNPASKKLDGCLIHLAGRYATTKFIRIKAREVDFDEEVCPTVLVYRAGDLIANLVMISYELSDDFDSAELEELLTKNRVISPHDQCQRETSFFDASLDLDTLNAQLGDLNMLGMGQVHSTSSSGAAGGGAASRRGILSGNVKEFRYQDDDDDDNDDEAEY
ncbi:hypothetical protein BGZ97_011546 [Linnemannia gamsii]|uniref:Phosducin domain-containing protein n=1 Tax=Linnemannia gamsii TaxID=64522 RepID=A0A9P6UN17_9FUNG|nr:hypothetical protein BGZ97_011546 [Linnemannia gamsii]